MIRIAVSPLRSRKPSVNLRADIAALESSSRLQVAGGQIVATVEFLTRLAGLLTRNWRTAVTPSQAWQVWIALSRIDDAAKEATKCVAEVSYWFGIDATRLSPDVLAGYYANLPRIRAIHALENQLFNPLDYEAVYYLTLLAYDDEPRALAARSKSMQMMIDKTKGRG